MSNTAYRTHQSITFFPVFHFRLEFAAVVRQALAAHPPDVIAVELPGTWRDKVLEAVDRLPYLSLVFTQEGDNHLFLPVEPIDAFIEAIRTGRELGIPVEFIDLDVEGYPMMPEPMADTYPVAQLGYDRVMRHVLERVRFSPHPQDDARETMMAHALQALSAGGKRVTCVLGAAHLKPVLAKLAEPQPRPFARAKARELHLYNWAEKSIREFLNEAPYLVTAYEGWRQHVPGLPKVSKTARPGDAFAAQVEAEHHLPLTPEEYPPLDRARRTESLLLLASGHYLAETGEEVTPQQFRRLGEFARRYARVEGMLVPDLYQLLVAARGVVSDDFARAVWEEGSRYPWLDESGHYPSVEITGMYAYLQGRRLTLRSNLHRDRPRLRHVNDRQRLREKTPGQWQAEWSGRVICSHVPEDLVIEDYARNLKRHARGLLTAHQEKSEPFTASIKDGLDVRETLRNWFRKELYVKEVLQNPGDVGSVVVIFDEDAPPPGKREGLGARFGQRFPGKYPWLVTWLGENDQESDMALYATPAGEEVVGPGISRCQYGGFLLSYPPRRMADVWSDPFYDVARDKAERLLLAALDYSRERHVLYVAEKPPRTWFHTLAGRMGRQIIYVPIGSLSRHMLHKVRTFHVLEGHHVREYAKAYIGG